MRITVVTPARQGERSGNRATAVRWARLLRRLGHRISVRTACDNSPRDVLLAIHAWRSADAIRMYRAARPDAPLIVCLAGTDIYRFQQSHPEETRRSMEMADLLIGLHDLVARSIPEAFRGKLRIIRQSAPTLRRRAASKRRVDVVVAGHLRDEKDPMRAAYAARALPPESKVRIVHLGRAMEPSYEALALEEMRRNPRYRWYGELPRWAVRRRMARAHAMLISSRMEGGANIVSEAVMAGLPILASEIDGNVGLLGKGYPGYFPVEDTAALTELLVRLEHDACFAGALERHVGNLIPDFTEDRELDTWREVLREITP